MNTIKIQEFAMPRMTRTLYRQVDEGAKAFWARRGMTPPGDFRTTIDGAAKGGLHKRKASK
jgi:hypothetical protein